MRSIRLFHILILVVSFSLTPSATAATLNVPADYSTIQSCIDAAVSGEDECLVAPGTYNELINFLGKAITLRSSHGPTVTTIDGAGLNGSVVKCISGEGTDTTLKGFTITGGVGSSSGPGGLDPYGGGGMHNKNSNPTVTDCAFVGNTAFYGAGMLNHTSSPTVRNCTFTGNAAASGGGGMHNYYSSNVIVTNCMFRGNNGRVTSGLSNDHSSSAVSNCTFIGNVSMYRGSMYNYFSDSIVRNCTFSGNSTSYNGGAMSNSGPTTQTVINCAFWANSPVEVENFGLAQTGVSFSDLPGGLPAGFQDNGGNINLDPMFVRNPNAGEDGWWGDNPATIEVDEGANDDYGDLRLQAGSPCINTGPEVILPLPGETDLDGHARLLCGRIDMGAYESGIGDVDCDQSVNLSDLGGWEVCETGPLTGKGDTGCEAFDFDGDGDIDLADMAQFLLTVNP